MKELTKVEKEQLNGAIHIVLDFANEYQYALNRRDQNEELEYDTTMYDDYFRQDSLVELKNELDVDSYSVSDELFAIATVLKRLSECKRLL